MTKRHEVSTYCWKNGADKLARFRVARNLQLIKKIIIAGKCNIMKYSKARCACIIALWDKCYDFRSRLPLS